MHRAAVPVPVLVVAFAVVVGGLLAPRAGAQNLLANPDFPTDVSGWDSDLLLEHSAAFGLPWLGAAQLTDFGFGGSTNQCVDVSGLPIGEPLAFGAYIRGGNISFEATSVLLQMIWYANTNCSEPNIVGGVGNRSNAEAHPVAEWFRIDCFVDEECVPEKPAGANSLRFEVLRAFGFPSESNLYIDGLFLERDLLFRDGFELGDTGEWSSVAP